MKKRKILIKDGRMIDPQSGRDECLDILIEDGEIAGIGRFAGGSEYDRIIDASGKIVAPGLIDVHVHFRDPGFTNKEDLFTGAEAAAKGGFTTVVNLANTKPVVDNAETLNYILNKAKSAKIKILQAASVSIGFGGKELVNMEELNANGAAGFTDDGIPLMDSKLVLSAMEKAKELNVPISFHEEDPALIKDNGVNCGRVAEEIGLTGAPGIAEESLVARDCMLALESRAKVCIQHLSSGNSVELIRHAKTMGANIVAEATPHHFSLTEDAVLIHGANAKMNPPLRSEWDRTKIIEGLCDGTIEIIATDHAPHAKEEKERGFRECLSGIIGLETSLALGITNLVRKGYLTISKLLEKMTVNPARLYGLDAGVIKEGAAADLVVFDPDEEWEVTDFLSKSSNSPFKGEKLLGRVKYTICNGNIVYEDK